MFSFSIWNVDNARGPVVTVRPDSGPYRSQDHPACRHGLVVDLSAIDSARICRRAPGDWQKIQTPPCAFPSLLESDTYQIFKFYFSQKRLYLVRFHQIPSRVEEIRVKE